MPINDDGESEYILGNKQLLSVFFIVIILLGVFFTIGYIVGRNSGPADTAKKTAAGDTSAPVRSDAQSAMPAAPPAAAIPTVVEPVKASPVTPEPQKASRKEPIEVTAVNGSVTQPTPGQIYIQVLAVAKPEAEVLAEVLAKKGFRALVAPGPSEKIFRVLVGPAKDASDAGKIKGDLEQAGFKLAFPKKF